MEKLKLVPFTPENKKELKKFIDLAWSLNKNDPAWVPPLRLTVLDSLDTKRNPFYQHAKIQLWNAYRGSEHVGRIAAIVDEEHNRFHQEKMGFWGFLESVNDSTVTSALFQAAEEWLRAQGMEASRGPANPSLNHECGMLMNGFADAPYVMMTHNLSYYPALAEKSGYTKVKDLLAFNMKAPEKFDERFTRIAERVKKKGSITFRPINMKKFAEDVKIIKDIYNGAWEKNWGFVPMTDAEFEHMAKSMKDVIWPEFCLIAESKGEPVGFSLSLPDINQVLREIPNGKLLPLGIFKLLLGLRPKAGKITRVRVITLGVKKEWRGSGVASVFYYETYKRAVENGLWGGECSWILEDNKEMVDAVRAFSGVDPYKTYRMYEKSLS